MFLFAVWQIIAVLTLKLICSSLKDQHNLSHVHFKVKFPLQSNFQFPRGSCLVSHYMHIGKQLLVKQQINPGRGGINFSKLIVKKKKNQFLTEPSKWLKLFHMIPFIFFILLIGTISVGTLLIIILKRFSFIFFFFFNILKK